MLTDEAAIAGLVALSSRTASVNEATTSQPSLVRPREDVFYNSQNKRMSTTTLREEVEGPVLERTRHRDFDEEQPLSQTVVIARPRHGTEQVTYEQALKDERLIVAIKNGTYSIISHTPRVNRNVHGVCLFTYTDASQNLFYLRLLESLIYIQHPTGGYILHIYTFNLRGRNYSGVYYETHQFHVPNA